MNIGRIILALLIIVSAGMLPAASGAEVDVNPAEPAGTSVMQQDMPDCCPRGVNPCAKAMDHCGAMATCALKCFSFAGTSAVVIFPPAFTKITPSLTGNPFSSQMGSPPFRPPRT